jgi:hypothetical protein
MLSQRLRRRIARAGLGVMCLLSGTPQSFAQMPCGQGGDCKPSCLGWFNCPPPYKHCMEGPPCICFKCGCPKPVCCPANAPNWGYFQTCWRPWPWPPDWSHCYGAPPASQLIPPLANAYMTPVNPSGEAPGTLPTPRMVPPSIRPGY